MKNNYNKATVIIFVLLSSLSSIVRACPACWGKEQNLDEESVQNLYRSKSSYYKNKTLENYSSPQAPAQPICDFRNGNNDCKLKDKKSTD